MAQPVGSGRRLRVDLALDLDPDESGNCPIVAETADASDVSVNAVGHECTVDIRPTGGEGLVSGRGRVSEGCLCRVFQRFDCVPHIRRVEDGTVRATTYVDDRKTVRNVVGGLRESLDRVRVAQLAVVEGSDAAERVTVDLSGLTPKQREGIELAVARGYFDDESVRLGDLAEELDIGKSALSRRLRCAQSKLVTDAFDGDGE
ncbi:helix-turn-helix domain-containing protein [Halorubrum trueperi]|uniref:Helix-turn-helix domain-containing protein n=1 Tax=Halorubrum trueperi TaxID=2004704 RepID=A0ABD5USQ2_9EURY